MAAEGEFDHGEKQRLMVLAAGRMGGGGLEPSADSDGTRRPKAVKFLYRPQHWTRPTILNSTEITDSKTLRFLSVNRGRC